MQTKPRELRELSWPVHSNSSANAEPREEERVKERREGANERSSLNCHEGPVLLIVLNKTTGAK